MPARVDTDDNQVPSLVAEAAYSDEFLAALKSEFKFDALDPKLAQEIRRIARMYILDCRLEDDDGDRPKKSRKSYQSFLKVTETYLDWLKKSYGHPDFYNIATEMLMIAQSRHEPEPQNDFPELTEHERNVEAHYRELVRLTEVLKATLIRGIESSKPKPGPKQDFALRHLIISSSEFWTKQLGRKFTFDYHRGAGLTQAFYFVWALITRLDSVSEKEVVRAMRAEISEWGKSKRKTD